MISDTLADAVVEMDEYLADDHYADETRGRLLELRHRMDGMRAELDTFPFDGARYAVVGRSGPLGRNLHIKGACALAEASGGAVVMMAVLERIEARRG